MIYPARIGSVAGGEERWSTVTVEKRNPATGELLTTIAIATKESVLEAVDLACSAQALWSGMTAQERSDILRRAALLMQEKQEEIASLVALETGRSKKHALGEIVGAVQGGLFMANQVSALSSNCIESSNPNREVMLVRTNVGVGALFTPFNSPFILLVGKMFPALLCGNAVVIKAHELAPYTPIVVVKIFIEAGVPKEVLAVLQGGNDTGEALVADSRIRFVSFTGSSKGGSEILSSTAQRLTRVSVEAGGKNPFVVCADANIEHAVSMAVAGVFVDAGQRCTATSRIIVLESVYEEFKASFLKKVAALKIGMSDTDDYGALISLERCEMLQSQIENAKARGVTVCVEGSILPREGYFMTPTVLENVSSSDPLSQEELFGPVVILYRAQSIDEAIAIANNSSYRLSSAIHTRDMKIAERFAREHGAGVTRINGPTFGSESHMPFGGEGRSGNGWREPGVEALDFYSSLTQVSVDRF